MKKIDVLGVKVSVVNNQNIIDVVIDILKKKKQIQIATPNPEHIICAQENKEFREILNKCDIAVPDGIGLVKAMRRKMKNSDDLERVTGVDLMEKLCVMAEKKGLIVGLLGTSEDTREETVKVLKEKYKNLEVFALKSHENIKESVQEDKEIISQINDKKIDFLFVAYGAPYQELWINKNLTKLKTVKLAMGVGGAFDFISGEIKRAPVSIQKMGLEWLFRLFQEPWRIKRQMRLMKFIWLTR